MRSPRVLVTYEDGARYFFDEEAASKAHIDAGTISTHDTIARTYVYEYNADDSNKSVTGYINGKCVNSDSEK